MPTPERLAEQFEEHRPHVRAVAYRMLGSVGEAEDAVQETWIRLSRADVSGVDNLRGWLTTVVARVCLDMLRTRASRREDPLDMHVPDPIIRASVVETKGQRRRPCSPTLSVWRCSWSSRSSIRRNDWRSCSTTCLGCPSTRSRPSWIVRSSPRASSRAARAAGSRDRRRRQTRTCGPQRRVVDAFLAAVHDGDFEALVTVLDPEIVLRADGGAVKGMSRLVRGAQAVVAQAATFSKLGLSNQVVLVNGNIGVVSRLPDGRRLSVIGFTIAGGKVVEMDILADPDRLSRLDLSAIEP